MFKYFYLIALSLSMIACKNTNENINKDYSRLIDSVASSNHQTTVSSETIKEQQPKVSARNCTVCNKKFTHNGYEEISEGNWVPLSDPYTNQICSASCGLEHTKRTYQLANDVYNKYNNGIDPNSKKDYQVGNNGRVYETKKCSMCFGVGHTTYLDPITGQKKQETCSMCYGEGHLSY